MGFLVEDLQLVFPPANIGHWLTLADLTKTNDEIALVVKTNGQPIKTYKMQFEAPAVRERRARKRRWRFVSSYSSSSFLPLRV